MKNAIQLLVLLFAPLLVLESIRGLTGSGIAMASGTAVLFVICLVAGGDQDHRFGALRRTVVITAFVAWIVINIMEIGLLAFSGNGFSSEALFHFELESFRIGFYEFRWQSAAFFLVAPLLVWAINRLAAETRLKGFSGMPVLALIALAVLGANGAVGRFSASIYDFNFDQGLQASRSDIANLESLGVINTTSLTPRNALTAEASTSSKNLILLYLESFNANLIDSTQYAGLTPRLTELAASWHQIDHLSSAYVTIEGMISSQCGTLLPMTAANNTFLESGQLMQNMPCLGDVLGEAGYTQYYLGGAAMEFAGKGLFLEGHGYDHVWGSEYWLANGFTQPEGIWGLSDVVLFDNAVDTIRSAAENPPYNVTLLTLGTHLPGYLYDGCTPYEGNDEPFINAIHCTDQLVGRFVDRLIAEDLLEDTVVMLVADHGVFPTPKMRELFGDGAEDRRLVALTSYEGPIPDLPMSTYDIAPTLLDMLGVEHNAEFLFGRSLFDNRDTPPRHVTRYLDWQDGKLVSNPAANCDEPHDFVWPLNSCQKARLVGLTDGLLDYYSVEAAAEPLACDVEMAWRAMGDDDPALFINGSDHFEHFSKDGYRLASVGIDHGIFVLDIDASPAIVGHRFFRDAPADRERLTAMLAASDTPLMTIDVGASTEGGDAPEFRAGFLLPGAELAIQQSAEQRVTLNLCELLAED